MFNQQSIIIGKKKNTAGLYQRPSHSESAKSRQRGARHNPSHAPAFHRPRAALLAPRPGLPSHHLNGGSFESLPANPKALPSPLPLPRRAVAGAGAAVQEHRPRLEDAGLLGQRSGQVDGSHEEVQVKGCCAQLHSFTAKMVRSEL